MQICVYLFRADGALLQHQVFHVVDSEKGALVAFEAALPRPNVVIGRVLFQAFRIPPVLLTPISIV